MPDDEPGGTSIRTSVAHALATREDELVVAATARMLGAADPEDRPADTELTEELGREQQRFHLQHLRAALAADRPQLFDEYARWAATLLEARGLGASSLQHHLGTLSSVVTDHLGPDAGALVQQVVEGSLSAVGEVQAQDRSELDPASPHAELARRYLGTVLAGNRRDAVRLISEAAATGTPLEAIYLDVLAPCLREIGLRWQLGSVSVAQEHLVTATTQLAMAQLYPQLFATPRIGRRVAVTSIDHELHEVGARMVADLFELRGWDTTFLGASTPTEDLVAMVGSVEPDVLAVSATLPTHVELVRTAIAAVRASGADPIVLVGGRPFLQVADLWTQVGADGTAPDAASAVEIAADLVRAT